jgi:biotin operon repressor
VRKLSESQRRFPANTSLDSITFLNNKKINGELYGMFQSMAQSPFGRKGDKNDTVVYKKDLPTQSEICAKLNMKSPKTLRAHITQLIETGYLIEDEKNKCYILPEKEDMYLLVPLTTS